MVYYAVPSILIFPNERLTNPFIHTLAEAFRAHGSTVAVFRADAPQTADIVLVNWMERNWVPARGSSSDHLARQRRQSLLLGKLDDLRAAGTTVVWVAHNEMPHEWAGTRDEWLRISQPFFDRVDAVVHLTEASAALPSFDRLALLPRVVVPLIHFELVDAANHRDLAGPIERVLLLGDVQARKHYDEVVEAFAGTSDLELVIAGTIDDSDEKVRSFIASVAGDERISVIAGPVDDAVLHALFDGRSAVVLDQPGALNSAVLFLALARGGVVLCPDTPWHHELADRYGHHWIRTFASPLDAATLQRGLADPTPSELPDLSACFPALVTARLLEFFAELRR